MPNTLKPSYYTVTCPECGANSDFEGWPVIPNVFLPDVTDTLMEGSLFEYECTSCGYRDLVVYRCLYHDIPNATLVLLEPDSARRDDAIRILREKTRDDGERDDDVPRHTGRLVKHPDELSEKARILDAGLDDCAIELMLNPPEIEDFIVDQAWAFKHMAKGVTEGI